MISMTGRLLPKKVVVVFVLTLTCALSKLSTDELVMLKIFGRDTYYIVDWPLNFGVSQAYLVNSTHPDLTFAGCS